MTPNGKKYSSATCCGRGCPGPDSISRRTLIRQALICSTLPFLPIVTAADAAAIGVIEVAPGLFVHQGPYADVSPENAGDIANMSFVIGSDAVAVIDTGGSAKVGATLLEAIRTVTPLPVRYVINTHMHPDHVFGNAAFTTANAGAKPQFVAHHKMARGLATRAEGYLARNKEFMGDANFAGTTVVLPDQAVTDTLALDLGGRTLKLVARPTAHTDNDLTVADSATGTLILGDIAFAGRIPTIDGSILGWLKLIDALKSESAARVVPGHGPSAMAMADALSPLERYLKAIATDVRAAIKAGAMLSDTVETAARSEADKWLLFSEHHKRNVTAAFAELEWE